MTGGAAQAYGHESEKRENDEDSAAGQRPERQIAGRSFGRARRRDLRSPGWSERCLPACPLRLGSQRFDFRVERKGIPKLLRRCRLLEIAGCGRRSGGGNRKKDDAREGEQEKRRKCDRTRLIERALSRPALV